MTTPFFPETYHALPVADAPQGLSRELGNIERAIRSAMVRPFRTVTSSVTLNPLDANVDVDTTAGSVTITLPPVRAATGREYNFKKTVAANTVTLASSALIDGASTLAFTTQWTSYTLYSTGTTWRIK